MHFPARAALFSAMILLASSASAQTYELEADHTYPSFETPHMGISIFRGKVDKSSGSFTLDRAAKTGTLEVLMDAASVDFGNTLLNERMHGERFFNVAKFPTMSYKGTSVTFNGDTPVSIDGSLTLLGITRPLTLTVNSFKCIQHPIVKKEVCGADASASFKRSDFGMTAATGPDGGEVKMAIQAEAIRKD